MSPSSLSPDTWSRKEKRPSPVKETASRITPVMVLLRAASHVSCLRTLLALLDLVLDSFTFLERAIAIHLNGGVMHEQILAAGGRTDEPVALGVIEPLHRTLEAH